jgi:protein TonB
LVPPRPITTAAGDQLPVYPALARRRGEQGRVVLRVNVSADGVPLAVTVDRTSGYASLDDAAATAVRRWRFVPATEDGHPVRAMAVIPVQFRLEE